MTQIHDGIRGTRSTTRDTPAQQVARGVCWLTTDDVYNDAFTSPDDLSATLRTYFGPSPSTYAGFIIFDLTGDPQTRVSNGDKAEIDQVQGILDRIEGYCPSAKVGIPYPKWTSRLDSPEQIRDWQKAQSHFKLAGSTGSHYFPLLAWDAVGPEFETPAIATGYASFAHYLAMETTVRGEADAWQYDDILEGSNVRKESTKGVVPVLSPRVDPSGDARVRNDLVPVAQWVAMLNATGPATDIIVTGDAKGVGWTQMEPYLTMAKTLE